MATSIKTVWLARGIHGTLWVFDDEPVQDKGLYQWCGLNRRSITAEPLLNSAPVKPGEKKRVTISVTAVE